MNKAITPPFTLESAKKKVQMAEDLWNSQDPQKIILAYTEDSTWRNRGEFIQGRQAIEEFLSQKWQSELNYTLRKELFSFNDSKIAVQFEYEYQDQQGQWFRAYGNEHWQFAADGRMQQRDASINDIKILEQDRKIHSHGDTK